MSKKYELPQTFRVGKSVLLSNYLIGIHVVAICAIFLSAVSLIYQVSLSLLVLASLFFYLWREQKFEGFVIRHSSRRGWEIAEADHHFYAITVMPLTVVSRLLIVLHFKSTLKQKQTILICNDTMSFDDYRRLRVELKINGLKKEGV